MSYGEFIDTTCRIVNYFTDLAQKDNIRNNNSTPKIRGENCIYSSVVNERRIEDNEMT